MVCHVLSPPGELQLAGLLDTHRSHAPSSGSSGQAKLNTMHPGLAVVERRPSGKLWSREEGRRPCESGRKWNT